MSYKNTENITWLELLHQQPCKCMLSIYSVVLLKCDPFSPKYSQKTFHSCPMKANHGMYFVSTSLDQCSVSITAMIYAVSCYYIGLCYKGTRFYYLACLVTSFMIFSWSCKVYHTHDKRYTVRCRYNAINFIQNIHERHTIARPPGLGMGCFLRLHPMIDILPQFLQWCVHHDTLDLVITALECIGDMSHHYSCMIQELTSSTLWIQV